MTNTVEFHVVAMESFHSTYERLKREGFRVIKCIERRNRSSHTFKLVGYYPKK